MSHNPAHAPAPDRSPRRRRALAGRLSKKHKEDLDALESISALQEREQGAKGEGGVAEGMPSREAIVAARKERLEALWQELLGEYAAALASSGRAAA